MKIDFHIHFKITKRAEFSERFFLSMIQALKQEGLTAVTLTEHFHTLNFYALYDYLDEQYMYEHDYYVIDGLKVFPGMEVDIQEGGHILTIGKRDVLRKVRKKLEGYDTRGSFIDFKQLLNLLEGEGMLVIGAHPFRPGQELHHLPQEYLEQLCAFDLNARDLKRLGLKEMEEKVFALAESIGLPVVGGSDSHYPDQIGSVINHFEQDCDTVEELQEQIKNKKFTIQLADDLISKVNTAEMAKKKALEHLIRS